MITRRASDLGLYQIRVEADYIADAPRVASYYLLHIN